MGLLAEMEPWAGEPFKLVVWPEQSPLPRPLNTLAETGSGCVPPLFSLHLTVTLTFVSLFLFAFCGAGE